MLPFKLVYHSSYNFPFGPHVFPAIKYGLIRERLLADGIASEGDFLAPEPIPDDDLELVHTQSWIQRLQTGRLSVLEVARLEIPFSDEVIRGFWLHAGGSLLTARLAVADRISFNVGGGFHHAYPGHGEGFCAINDIGAAIRRLQKDGLIRRAMVIDCDVHHGNGTAAIFEGDASVFTLSIHQFNNYPADKPPSSLDIHLEDEVGDEEYLERLEAGYLPALAQFQPDLLFYVAGADPFREDQLGGLALTRQGLEARDRLVLNAALRAKVPAAIVLAGGYSRDVQDTISIHCNTARAALAALAEEENQVTF